MNDIAQLAAPKKIAKITICGAFHIEIYEDMFGNTDFIFPTEEQKKNLKEMLCIDVEDLRERSEGE